MQKKSFLFVFLLSVLSANIYAARPDTPNKNICFQDKSIAKVSVADTGAIHFKLHDDSRNFWLDLNGEQDRGYRLLLLSMLTNQKIKGWCGSGKAGIWEVELER